MRGCAGQGDPEKALDYWRRQARAEGSRADRLQAKVSEFEEFLATPGHDRFRRHWRNWKQVRAELDKRGPE